MLNVFKCDLMIHCFTQWFTQRFRWTQLEQWIISGDTNVFLSNRNVPSLWGCDCLQRLFSSSCLLRSSPCWSKTWFSEDPLQNILHISSPGLFRVLQGRTGKFPPQIWECQNEIFFLVFNVICELLVFLFWVFNSSLELPKSYVGFSLRICSNSLSQTGRP